MAKSEFLQVPPMDIIRGKRGWRLSGVLIYYSEHLGRKIIIPKGFETDLASVPQIVPSMIVDVANGPSRLPAIVHDWLCYTDIQDVYGIKQRHADKIFREALKARGVNWVSRSVVLWLPTRVFQFFTSPFSKTGAPPVSIGD